MLIDWASRAVLMPTAGDSGHVRLALDGGHATRLVAGPIYVIAGLFVGPLNYGWAQKNRIIHHTKMDKPIKYFKCVFFCSK